MPNIVFKTWAPDLPEVGDHLTNAQNVLPVNGAYEPYLPLSSTSTIVTASSITGAIAVYSPPGPPGTYEIYVGDSSSLRRILGTSTDVSSATYSAGNWNFALFEDLVFAVNTNNNVRPQFKTVGSSTAFTAASASAPTASAIGVIGKFVMVGNLQAGANHVQWPAIDDPTNWPTPGSATAIATQAGQQILTDLSPVRAIVGGDQFGLIVQQQGMTRVTYVGGNTVFQFDTLENSRGSEYPASFVQVDGAWYFFSRDGFFVTDGVSTIPIDIGINEYVRALGADFCFGAVDLRRSLIYWTAGVQGTTRTVLCYNYVEKRWTQNPQTSVRVLLTANNGNIITSVQGFHNSGTLGALSDTPTTAILETAETELNPGGRTFVSGIKPLIGAAINNVTVAVGSRSDRSSAISYTAETTANSRSSFADFRIDARYHKARFTISGSFTSAQGFEVNAVPSGAA